MNNGNQRRRHRLPYRDGDDDMDTVWAVGMVRPRDRLRDWWVGVRVSVVLRVGDGCGCHPQCRAVGFDFPNNAKKLDKRGSKDPCEE